MLIYAIITIVWRITYAIRISIITSITTNVRMPRSFLQITTNEVKSIEDYKKQKIKVNIDIITSSLSVSVELLLFSIEMSSTVIY